MNNDNEYIVNFDENFEEEENLIKDQLNLLEDTCKAFDSFNLEVQSIIKNSFDIEKEAKEILTDIENYHLEINGKREELDKKIKEYNEICQELKLENKASEMILNLKKLQKYNINKTELENINKHIQELKIILDKETEMIDKMKAENQEIVLSEKYVYDELEEHIRLYKEFSGMDVEKTEDGFLKIIFSNLNVEKIDAYVKLQISNDGYRIVDIFPKIDYRHLQELLKSNNNFTYFLASLVENFLQHFDKKG